MYERLITAETAKLGKKKGFNLRSQGIYGCDKPAGGGPGNVLIPHDWVKCTEIGDIDEQKGTMCYSAPTQTLLQTWLRIEHKIYVTVSPEYSSGKFRGKVKKLDKRNKYHTSSIVHGDIYEDVLELTLYKALNLIK